MSGVSCFDLLEAGQTVRNVYCDVCVIGAGAAGIYLAVQLASKGLDVILVEAGGSICGDASEVGFDVRFSADPYPGAIKGRAFGLGGTTSRWGGLLVPHTRHDLREPADVVADAWLSIVQTVSEKSESARLHEARGILRIRPETPWEYLYRTERIRSRCCSKSIPAGPSQESSLLAP
jgi:glycine/D-amino acid oxidase-like deaminating enzyme